jgi:uncharacterized protein (TIGR00725 family)
MSDRRVISVFGSGDAPPGNPEYAAAERVGQVLGSLGYAVANGGYGGTMEAASRGARSAGATVIGVTCRVWPGRANAFVDQVIETADLYERLRTLISLGTAGYVALPGATGTLLELAAVWELAGKGTAAARPIVCVGEYWRPLVALIGGSESSAASRISFVDSPDELPRHFQPLRLEG